MSEYLYPTCKITSEEFNRRHWDEEESLGSIARSLNIFPATLRHHALNAGLKTRTFQQSHQLAVKQGTRRTHTANYALFESWSPEMAWALGLMASDGNVNQAITRINFTSTDRTLSEKFKAVIEYTAPIKKRPNSNNWIVRIWNRQLAESLVVLNVGPAKSFTLEMSPVPNAFFRHYLRGFFDGDGCACIKARKNQGNRKPQLTATFHCPSIKWHIALESRLSYLRLNSRFQTKTYNDGIRKPMHTTYFSGYDAIQLYHFMYDGVDEAHYLVRKHKVFADYIAEYGERYENGPIMDLSHAGQPCKIEECDKPHAALGFCQKHYRQDYWMKYKTKPRPPCIIPGCDKPSKTLKPGLCAMHYERKYQARKR